MSANCTYAVVEIKVPLEISTHIARDLRHPLDTHYVLRKFARKSAVNLDLSRRGVVIYIARAKFKALGGHKLSTNTIRQRELRRAKVQLTRLFAQNLRNGRGIALSGPKIRNGAKQSMLAFLLDLL